MCTFQARIYTHVCDELYNGIIRGIIRYDVLHYCILRTNTRANLLSALGIFAWMHLFHILVTTYRFVTKF